LGKRALLLKLFQDIRASYWFLPTVLVIFGLLLATLTEWIDRDISVLPFNLPETFIDTQADGARSTLAVIAQSIIGVTGVTFSMTLVAVSFASGNFGPRLIGNFMRDRGNQWSLGILISTFVYSLVVLRAVQDGYEGGVDAFVPQYSLLVAMALMLLCIFTLIYFIHHVPETINVSRISASLGNRLETQIRDLIDTQTPSNDSSKATWPNGKPKAVIKSATAGYIQTCNIDRLKQLAQTNDWHIEMVPAIGDFVTIATDVLCIWSEDGLTDAQHADLESCFAIGSERTENQNPGFLAQQLVEMTARALSPGINDPYTAMDCLNRLASALVVSICHDGGLHPIPSERLRRPQLDFERLFSYSFPLCRQYVRPDDITRAHSLSLLEDLLVLAPQSNRKLVQAEIDGLKAS